MVSSVRGYGRSLVAHGKSVESQINFFFLLVFNFCNVQILLFGHQSYGPSLSIVLRCYTSIFNVHCTLCNGLVWIEITNSKADGTKVCFNDGVGTSSLSHLPIQLCPGSSSINIVLKHLQTKARHQSTNSTQNLISVVSPTILSTSDNHLLVQVSSSKTDHIPGENLLCTEEHKEH